MPTAHPTDRLTVRQRRETMQIPEQIARDIIVREYGEIEITRTNVLVDGARLVELIAAGIKAADDRRRYQVTIEYVRTGERRTLTIDPEDGESIVEAVIREGDAAEEWALVEVQP